MQKYIQSEHINSIFCIKYFIDIVYNTMSEINPNKYCDIHLDKFNELNLIEFLKSLKNQKFTYIPNSGNCGDALIAEGTYQLFDKIGLDYNIGSMNSVYTNEVLISGGGGGFNNLYPLASTFLKNNMNNMNNNVIIILPHTIMNVDECISLFHDNVFVICREYYSYDYVCSKIKNKKNVFLSKDMAFYLDVSRYNNISGSGTLNFLRTDTEKTDIKIPDDNMDISVTIPHDYTMTNKKKVNEVTYEFLDVISKYEVINTNRTHGGIGGSLLNKTVYLHTNSYWKNKAIYEYSLENIYPKTSFI